MQRSSQTRTAHLGPVMPSRPGHEKHGPIGSPSNRSPQNSDDKPVVPSAHPSTTDVRGGVYVISVAARILDMHPQTLRKYERLGLVTPIRSIGMLRLYSAEDVVRVRLIKYMVENLGMNLAGVEYALSFLNRVLDLRERIQTMSQAQALSQFVLGELEEMLRELGGIFPDNPTRMYINQE